MKINRWDDGTELYHHGIKGQKWGVRNGPPYPIDHKSMTKGTRLNSVSGRYWRGQDYLNSGRSIYTFNPDDKWDSAIYRGPFSKYLVMYRGARFVKEYEFETVKDLKMPTRAERVQEFKDLYNDPKFKKAVVKELGSVERLLNAQGVSANAEKPKNFNFKNLKTDADYAYAYGVFNHAMEASWYYKSTKEYMNRMENKYDAMVDDNNQGVYNEAHDPVIIFRANEALKVLNERYLTADEIVENYNKVATELNKKGKRVKL